MTARRVASIAAAFLVMAGAALPAFAAVDEGSPQTSADACRDDEIPVPDERETDATLCMAKAEWERAKAICEALAPDTDPLECTCQDGDAIGACGD